MPRFGQETVRGGRVGEAWSGFRGQGSGVTEGVQLALFRITAAASTSPTHSVESSGLRTPAQLVLQFFNFKNNFALPTYVWSKISSVNIYNKTSKMNTASAEDYKKAERAIKTKKRQPNQNQSQPQLKQLLQQLKTGQSQKGGQQRQKKS